MVQSRSRGAAKGVRAFARIMACGMCAGVAPAIAAAQGPDLEPRAQIQSVTDPAAQEAAATAARAAHAEKYRAIVEAADGGGFWGGVAVARNGIIEYAEGFGPADDAWNPITVDSLFDAGSVTKQFTAAAILKLETEGELSTNDPVSKFFPDAGGRSEMITLHHLLTHTSGISDMDALQHLGFPDRDEAVRIAMNAPERSAPGERFAYCNAGFIVLAAIIEVASGKSYENYIYDALFLPANMSTSGFLDGKGLDPARQVIRATRMLGPGPDQDAQGIRRVPLFASPDGEPWGWGLKGAGGALTTTGDLVKWDRALAGDGVLNADAKEKLYKVEKAGYACGWIVEPLAGGGTRIHHGGGTRGFTCEFSRYVDEGVAIIVWTYESGFPMTLEQLLADAAMPGIVFASMQATIQTGGLEFSEHQTSMMGGIGVSVARIEANPAVPDAGAVPEDRLVELTVTQADEAGTSTLGTVRMPATAAAKLAHDLTVAMQATDMVPANEAPIGDAGTASGSAYAMVAKWPYEVGAEGSLTVGPNLSWGLMPGYDAPIPEAHGGGSTGPDRIAIGLMDREKSFMPLIVWVDADHATVLVRMLTTH